jgi:hypothetical protein
MGIDAVALLRVKSMGAVQDRLKPQPFHRPLMKQLDDGSVLLSTLARFGARGSNELPLRICLTQLFGNDLASIHDDPRGVLLFPDVAEPRGRTYEAVVAEVGAVGVWLPVEAVPDSEMEAYVASIVEEATKMTPEAYAEEMQRRMARGAKLRDALAKPLDLGDIEAMAKKLGLGSFEEIAASARERAGKLDMSLACVLIQKASGPPVSLPNANEVHRLGDGSLVVVTQRLMFDHEHVEHLLRGPWSSCLDGHSDPRGVISFSSRHLADVLACADYASAVERAGDSAVWLK